MPQYDLETGAPMDEVAVHYGIKGMKWGVRRAIGPDGRVRNSRVGKAVSEKAAELNTQQNRNRARKAIKVATTPEDMPYKRMTNKELQERITRLQLEENFRRLDAADRAATRMSSGNTPLKRGARVAKALLADDADLAIAEANHITDTIIAETIRKKMREQLNRTD